MSRFVSTFPFLENLSKSVMAFERRRKDVTNTSSNVLRLVYQLNVFSKDIAQQINIDENAFLNSLLKQLTILDERITELSK